MFYFSKAGECPLHPCVAPLVIKLKRIILSIPTTKFIREEPLIGKPSFSETFSFSVF